MPRPRTQDLRSHAVVNTDAFSFASAAPSSCPAMCVWGVVDHDVSYGLHSPPNEALSPFVPTAMPMHDDLDPDLIEAYKKSLTRMQSRRGGIGCAAGMEPVPRRDECSYLVMDEAVLACMCKRGWSRQNGQTFLVPFALAIPAFRPICV